MYILIILAALLLELILMCVLEDFLLMGIMILTIGFLILFSALKGHAKIKKAAVPMAVYCFLWGMVMIGFSVAEKITGSFPDYGIVILAAGLGCAMVWLGILFLFVSYSLIMN